MASSHANEDYSRRADGFVQLWPIRPIMGFHYSVPDCMALRIQSPVPSMSIPFQRWDGPCVSQDKKVVCLSETGSVSWLMECSVIVVAVCCIMEAVRVHGGGVAVVS